MSGSKAFIVTFDCTIYTNQHQDVFRSPLYELYILYKEKLMKWLLTLTS